MCARISASTAHVGGLLADDAEHLRRVLALHPGGLVEQGQRSDVQLRRLLGSLRIAAAGALLGVDGAAQHRHRRLEGVGGHRGPVAAAARLG